jgi:O-antigen/teichoic acid export membrane protein
MVFLKLWIVYLLVVIPYDKLKVYALLMFCVNFFISSIYIIICRKRFPESKFLFRWDKDIFKSIFSYSSWTLLGSLAFVLNTQGLNILFNLFFGPIANAAYAIGSQVKTTINQFASNFFVATRPPMIKSYAEGNYTYTNKLFYFSSKVIFSLLFVMIAPLFIEIEYVLLLWLGEVEHYMPSFVRLMLIYAIILSVSEPITAIVQAAGKVKIYHGLVDTFTLLTLPLSYIAFKMGFKPQYGFIISIAVFMVAHIMRLYVLRSFHQFSIREYIVKFILPCALTIFFASGFIYGVSKLPIHPILVIVVAILFASFSIWLFVFNKDERYYALNIVKSKFLKKHE